MSTMLARFLVAVLFLSSVPAGGRAQSATRNAHRDDSAALMTAGAHVRVKLPGEHVWTGTLVSLDGDSMFVRGRSGDDTTLVRLSRATYVNVSAGMRRSPHVVRNTVIGLGLGAGLGSLIGGAMTSGGCELGDPCSDRLACLLGCVGVDLTPNPPIRDHGVSGAVIGGLAGGAVGLLVSRHRSHDWRPVSLVRHRTEVSLIPWRGGVAITYSARQ